MFRVFGHEAFVSDQRNSRTVLASNFLDSLCQISVAITIKRAVKQGFRKPLLCPTAYAANKRLDRDRDGVACERPRR